jgi:hypothetical protein
VFWLEKAEDAALESGSWRSGVPLEAAVAGVVLEAFAEKRVHYY